MHYNVHKVQVAGRDRDGNEIQKDMSFGREFYTDAATVEIAYKHIFKLITKKYARKLQVNRTKYPYLRITIQRGGRQPGKKARVFEARYKKIRKPKITSVHDAMKQGKYKEAMKYIPKTHELQKDIFDCVRKVNTKQSCPNDIDPITMKKKNELSSVSLKSGKKCYEPEGLLKWWSKTENPKDPLTRKNLVVCDVKKSKIPCRKLWFSDCPPERCDRYTTANRKKRCRSPRKKNIV
jgi:hypothetical protein